ncbi:MAG: hypothetical protein JWR38_3944 [Mucilaginibacter sp.]|nr:hypothetical protein [Mucilaginibacter sp.]
MKFIDCYNLTIYYGKFIAFASFDAIFIKKCCYSKQVA